MLPNLTFIGVRDPCILGPESISNSRGSYGRKHWRKQLFTLICLTTVTENSLFMRDYSSYPWNCSKAFRPDYYMRVFPQPAWADYPTCYNQCQLTFLSLPAVCAAGLQAIFRIIADVNLQGFIGRDWKTGQASRHGPSFGIQQPLYNRQPGLNVMFLSF